MAVRIHVCLLSLILAAGMNGGAQTRSANLDSQTAAGPFPSDNQSIHGRIVHEPGASLDRLYVEVQQLGVDSMARRVPVSPDGSFDFNGTPGASYMVRITTLEGNVLTESFSTPNALGYLEVRLPYRSGTSPATGTISAFELGHKVAGKAQKEGRTADKCLLKHDMDGYIEHAEKAVAIDPDFLAARRNLGVVYLRSGNYAKSIDEFQEVLKRDPRSLIAYNGLSAAYIQLHQYSRAENTARRAVNIDPASQVGHFLLGLSLDMQNKDQMEALVHLAKASGQMPKAHLVAAQIFERAGKTSEMKDQLKAYLASGDKEAQSQVQSLLSSLK